MVSGHLPAVRAGFGILFRKGRDMKALFAVLTVLGLSALVGCDSPKVEKAKAKMEEAAHDTAEASKEVVHEAADATKKAAHEAAGAVKEGAEKIEEETR
jgi:hypothetical protein